MSLFRVLQERNLARVKITSFKGRWRNLSEISWNIYGFHENPIKGTCIMQISQFINMLSILIMVNMLTTLTEANLRYDIVWHSHKKFKSKQNLWIAPLLAI
jgi:hypothetical protein